MPVLLVALAAGCGSRAPSHGLGGVVSADGRVGDLRIDRSEARDVIAQVGQPEAERRARESSFDPPYRALGYGCSRAETSGGWPLGRRGPFCGTVFFVNLRTRRLGAFYTTSSRYSEAHGVRIGMRTARAERLLHQLVYDGCEENVHLSGRESDLTVAFAGGRPRIVHGAAEDLIGGHVYAFVLHSRRHDIGVWDCL